MSNFPNAVTPSNNGSYWNVFAKFFSGPTKEAGRNSKYDCHSDVPVSKNRDTLSLIPLESELATANVGECNSWSRNSEGESAGVTGESVEIDVVSAQL